MKNITKKSKKIATEINGCLLYSSVNVNYLSVKPQDKDRNRLNLADIRQLGEGHETRTLTILCPSRSSLGSTSSCNTEEAVKMTRSPV